VKRVPAGHCRCGAITTPTGYLLEAVYVTDAGTRHQKSWCCEWCALGHGCLCSVWTTPPSTTRLDSLLDRLEGTR
jgi:hypothetical protein